MRVLLGYRDTSSVFSTWNSWFNERCEIKRISNDGSLINHTKCYCVDDELLYIGNDNCYPNYNEEFGVWIEDKTVIGKWKTNSWDKRWGTGTAKALDDKVEATLTKYYTAHAFG